MARKRKPKRKGERYRVTPLTIRPKRKSKVTCHYCGAPAVKRNLCQLCLKELAEKLGKTEEQVLKWLDERKRIAHLTLPHGTECSCEMPEFVMIDGEREFFELKVKKEAEI